MSFPRSPLHPAVEEKVQARTQSGPDFICVGMPKCGTGWLFDQLESHPDFWMPPVKELLYLDEAVPQLRFLKHRSRQAVRRVHEKPPKKLGERLLRRDLQDPRDHGFVEYAASIQGQNRDLDRYAGMFVFKGGLMSGDVSPPYWNLGEKTVASIAARFPASKILLLVRDPVARAWSRISVLHRSGKVDADILDNPSQLREILRVNRAVGGAFATEVALRWLRHIPSERLFVVLFDDIGDQPVKVRGQVLQFLGADPMKKSEEIAPDHNRKAGDMKLTLTENIRDQLAEYFRNELLACAALFGGRAVEWPTRYGL